MRQSLREVVTRSLAQLKSRELDIVQNRCLGATLDELARDYSLTRERCRQIAAAAFRRLTRFRDISKALLLKATGTLAGQLFHEGEALKNQLDLADVWHVPFVIELSNSRWERHSNGKYCRLPSKCLQLLEAILKTVTRDKDGFSLCDFETAGDIVAASQVQGERPADDYAILMHYLDEPLSNVELKELLGNDWLKSSIRSQLIDGGVNGLHFSDLRTGGLISHPSELQTLMGDELVWLSDDFFRRKGEGYNRAVEILDILREAESPVDVEYIMSRSKRKWHQAPLVGNYLSRLFEVVNTGRGLYSHIAKLGLSVTEVKAISSWGADLLAGENRAVDGNELFDLFKSSQFQQKLSNAHQLVSIIAKHIDVRRLSNNLQLAHRNSFDTTELSLAKTDPDIASQWHPTKNGLLTPAEVRPNSFKSRWWKCEKGHEFQAMPVYRTRMVRSCPGCQEKWSLEKIRHFVRSLRDHLEALTPAELFVIFQQSGLLNKGGRAKGFVKSLTTGRFPVEELDKFIRGDASVVDEFISDSDFELSTLDNAEAELIESDVTIQSQASQPEGETAVTLPKVTAKAALAALDSPVIASADAEAVEFLVASAKAKIWSHAFRNSEQALKHLDEVPASDYSVRVRNEFLSEYRQAIEMELPSEYAFKIKGRLTPPNLMQRHVAVEVRNRQRFGNWSGTGAGKTLSAVLASRICNSLLTVVCCPNAVVGDESSGWSGEIRRIFPDSDVQVKTWHPEWRANSRHRYLVLNYDQFQQAESDARLKRFLEENLIDFIVIDEVHQAKQRVANQMSKRKRLIQAMVSEAGRANKHLHVLGLSATPVINNLQEGRSLVEMITGMEHGDIPVKPTVPNCMRLYQRLSTLGTRWRPEYESLLKVQTVDVNCSTWIERIRSLGQQASPLEIEKILTQARLPAIIEAIRRPGRTLLYTQYVDGISKILYDAIVDTGLTAGFYTGEMKDGLEQFKRRSIDVLIASSAIGTGVDGIQDVCDRLVINSLPWTNAEYEQLIGRIWRQGQSSSTVEVIIPVTYAEVNGERWSYCQTKLDRITYKKSIADAAVDGVVPDGNLRSSVQSQRDILEWLKRLEGGEQNTIVRRQIIVPLADSDDGAKERYSRYGDFSMMNNLWNKTSSAKLAQQLQANPEEWEHYHTLYRKARESWPVVPYKEFIRWCQHREGYVIADFGCGEAIVAKETSNRHVVHSFDHVGINDSVIVGDMAHTCLDTESTDVALFSLSLMGSNFTDYLREAHRILKIDGQIHIWEATSRFTDPTAFASSIEQLGFRVFPPRIKGAFVHIEGRKTDRVPDPNLKLEF